MRFASVHGGEFVLSMRSYYLRGPESKMWVKMTNCVFAICLWVTCTGSLVGQVDASMSPPILNTGLEEISFTTRFSHFAGGSDYRLGVGTTGDELNNAKFELSKGDTVLSKKLVSFRQEFASAYFEVDEIFVQGFLFSSAELPDEGEEITLKATITNAKDFSS
jgi:hypothetical protein